MKKGVKKHSDKKSEEFSYKQELSADILRDRTWKRTLL